MFGENFRFNCYCGIVLSILIRFEIKNLLTTIINRIEKFRSVEHLFSHIMNEIQNRSLQIKSNNVPTSKPLIYQLEFEYLFYIFRLES